ncbi:hypothetical protein [Roseivirga sp. UBA838]|uniref:hypothetical protein n=1 Tax=Roseivirga sp. UBA838 TaxID=1947393 RepID=UPI00257C32F9|nr:hypothetical protein [Roseivirga sp. UBA838]|tara:strand:+ start:48807 stop:49700 length:894 start_codon:yes stop_codon:yes gene_type:complete
MRLKILTCFIFILLAQEAMGQRNINGRVFDLMDSLYLPYVTIINLDTKDTTKSNLEGYFYIKADNGDQLLFRYLGFVERTITLQNLKFLEVGLKPWSSEDDLGQNRIHIYAGVEINYKLIGGKLKYVSDYFGSFTFESSASYFFNTETKLTDAKIRFPRLIYSYPNVSIGTSIAYQNLTFEDNSGYESYMLSFQPRLRYFEANIGVGRNHFELDSKKTFGVLVGIKKEVPLGNYNYLPFESSVTFWGKNLQFNTALNYRIFKRFEIELGYQYFRGIDLIQFTLGNSIRLWRYNKNEY